MSQRLYQAQAIALNLGTGQLPLTLNVATCTPVAGDPRTVSVTVPWTEQPYNAGLSNPNVGVRIDLRSQQVVGIDKVRSVKIDNTYNDVPVFLQFADTLDTIVCLPNSVTISPVETNDQTAILFGTGFFNGRTPKTTVFFNNFDRQGLVLPGEVGNIVTSSLTDMSASAFGGLVANFNNQRYGIAYPGRLVVHCVLTSAQNAAQAVIPISVVSNGVPLLQAGAGVDTDVGGLLRHSSASIWYGIIPTGTTGNVVVTYPNNGSLAYLSTHVVRGYSEITPFDAGGDVQTTSDVIATASIDTVPGAAVIACAMDYNSPSVLTPPQWFGDVEMIAYRFNTAAAVQRGSFGAVDNYDRTGAASISTKANVLYEACWL